MFQNWSPFIQLSRSFLKGKGINAALFQIDNMWAVTYLLKTGNGKDSQENSDFSLNRNNEDRISAKQFNILTGF